MQCKVVGITRGRTKETQKPYTVLHVIKEFDDWISDNSEGNAVDTLFVRLDLDVEVGDTVVPVYGVGYQGKAIVENVLVNQE